MSEPTLELDLEALWRRFGVAMRLIRMGSHFTLRDIADRFDIPITTVSAMELGEGCEVRVVDESDQRVCMDCVHSDEDREASPCADCFFDDLRSSFVRRIK